MSGVSGHEQPAHSGFSDVDRASDPMEYVRRLDARGTEEFWQTVKRAMISLLDPRAGDHVLDIGCGAGDDVRSLARLVGAGRATGVDSSATMIAEAWKRSEGTGLPVSFFQGDAHCLDLPDESIDACRAERVFQHLDDPAVALVEAVRVMRPGGRIAVVEPDYGSQIIVGAPGDVTHRILRSRCAHFRSGTIGRTLPKLFKNLRLIDLNVTIFTIGSTDVEQESERALLRKYSISAEEAGMISRAERAAWLRDLDEAGAAGRYRRALAVFLVGGRKPGA